MNTQTETEFDTTKLSLLIREAFVQRTKLDEPAYRSAVTQTLDLLNSGRLRAAESCADGWVVHEWVKEAILLYFGIMPMEVSNAGPMEFFDKIPLKTGYKDSGVRVVPPAVARFGSFIEHSAILMPSYVNIGAYVGARSMIDIWTCIGSCAQIGCDVHVSACVVIGGVLEPVNARPVIIEDGAFIGAHATIVEGVIVESEAVIAANVSITASTPIIDVTKEQAVTIRGRVPARAVVVPGVAKKRYPAGEFDIQCAYIIGERSASTDKKTSLNAALRQIDELKS